MFWFRRAVPADLREAVGKREELRSLGTKDPKLARVKYAEVLAEVEARWANLRNGPRSLTESEAHVIARTAHDQWLVWNQDEPSEQFTWTTRLYPYVWRQTRPEKNWPEGTMPTDNLLVEAMRRFCFVQADNALMHHGMVVDDRSREKLAKAMGAAFQRASKTIEDLAAGELAIEEVPVLAARQKAENTPYVPPTQPAEAPIRARSSVKASKPDVTMTGLFEAWWREAQAVGRKPSTHESYSNTVKSLVAFLKHDDAERITANDIVAYKDHRLTTPSPRTGRIPSAKTVKDSDLSALKTLFGWAVMNRKLPTNPALGLTIKLGKAAQLRPKGFIDAEAHALLSAALSYEAGPREHPKTAAAKRWIPWLCAFSGARVGEIAQLRRQDLRREGDWWIVRVTPEAGTVKTNQARDIVLHAQLIELGFPQFVEASADGPLFLVPAKDGDVLGPLSGVINRMREFARGIVPDPKVQPNHGWRHLFTTMCIDAEIESRVYNAIQGHAGTTVAERYGDVTIKAKAAAIAKIPRFDVKRGELTGP